MNDLSPVVTGQYPTIGSSPPDWFRRALATSSEAFTVEHDEKILEVVAWGPVGAPGVLLMHGSMAHVRWWSFIAPFLADRYRVVAFSLSGHGNSTHAAPYSIAGYAAEALAVATASQISEAGRWAVVAHSAAGGIAARLAATYGKALRCAILIDSLILPGGNRVPPPPPLRKQRLYPSRRAAMNRYRLIPPQPERNRFLIDHVAGHGLRQVEGGWTWSFDPWLRGRFGARDAWSDLPAAFCPLYFVNGAESLVVTPERIALLRKQAPGGHFISIPDAHHHVLIDQPLALAAVLGTLLDFAS